MRSQAASFQVMQAATLNCLMCGAPVRSDAKNCQHCGARVATISCPSCFAMIFQEAKFCPHCGEAAARGVTVETQLPCPKCETPLQCTTIGQSHVHECARCFGLWVDVPTFDRICTDQEKQSAVLGGASETFNPGQRQVDLKFRYVKCPICAGLMHRVNFAKCSGVIVDICKGHGTWFDRDELQHIVEFIHSGGLEVAREKEKTAVHAARRHAEQKAAEIMDSNRGRVFLDEHDLQRIAGSLLSALWR